MSTAALRPFFEMSIPTSAATINAISPPECTPSTIFISAWKLWGFYFTITTTATIERTVTVTIDNSTPQTLAAPIAVPTTFSTLPLKSIFTPMPFLIEAVPLVPTSSVAHVLPPPGPDSDFKIPVPNAFSGSPGIYCGYCPQIKSCSRGQEC
ncbi:hypothetical protein GQ44DRAFT_724750 [Phaeosphaeriaceae sp. PMI808]|nr:hypothetical protein GQ44DRAFT_724750 [Phaeosphaeriaceae sp. PMI808]